MRLPVSVSHILLYRSAKNMKNDAIKHLNIIRISASLMIIVMMVFCVTFFGTGADPAYAEDDAPVVLASGECGITESVTWTLYKDGTFILSGNGAVAGGSESPWDDYKGRILKVVAEEGITQLGYMNFQDSINLKEVRLPSSLVSLDNRVFFNCTSLEEIYLPDGVVSVKDAFKQCTALKTVHMPEGLETLGRSMFEGCSSLDNVVIPSSTKEISDSAFLDCTSLKNITMHDGITKIGNMAFGRCPSLKNIELPQSLQIIGDMAFYSSGLERVEIPANTWKIGVRAFEFCGYLKDVLLHDGLEEIDSRAFASCYGLNWVDVPESAYLVADDILEESYDMRQAQITLPEDAVYNGNAFEPGPVVNFQGHKLVNGTDYTVGYAISDDEKWIFMTVTGRNRFYEYQRIELENPNYVEKPADPGNGNEEPGDGNDPGTGNDPGASGNNDPDPGNDPGNEPGTEPETGGDKDTDPKPIVSKPAANKITIDKKTLTVSYGKTVDLSRYATSVAKLHYESTNTGVATVTKAGVVKFKHPGTVKIKLTSGGVNFEKKTATITVTSRLASPKLKVKTSKGMAKLTWSQVTKAYKYQIYVRYPGRKSFALALNKSSKVKSVTHRGLTKGKTYRYKVRAAAKINGNWYYSPYSNIVKVKAK